MHNPNKEDWSKSLPEDPQGADALWELSSGFGESSTVDVEAAWKQFEQKLGKPKITSKKTSRFLWKRSLTAAAAAITMLFVINYFSASTSLKEYANLEASARTLRLEDNTSVSLSEGASIVVRMEDDARSVELIGEASFDVAPNKSRPFTVTTPELTLVVVGTEFSVQSGSNASVRVNEGHVKVRGRNEVDWTDLFEGESIVIEPTLLIAEEKTSVRPRTPLKFDAVALSEVVQSIETAHQIDLVIPTKLAKCSITADFSTNTVSEIASSLAVLFDAEMRIVGQTVELKGGRCQ